MDKTISTGIENTITITVEQQFTAAAFGSGLIDVLATPAMIGFMEKCSQEAVQPYLPDGYITLGTVVNIKHIKATPVGEKVTFHAVVKEAEGKKLTFEVTAHDEHGQIGLGIHKRAIVHAEKFMKSLANG